MKNPFDGLMSFGEAAAKWSLDESTLRKAVARGKLKDKFDCKKFGKQWIVVETAMLREYGETNMGDTTPLHPHT